MKNALAVAKREFRSAFDLPIAYVFIAAFLILAALGGLLGFFDRGVADLRDYFAGLRYAFVLFAPAVSMRLWAEERRSRTFELLFTLPVKPWEVVLGKFLGALGLVVVAVALGAVLPITLSRWGQFDAGAIAAGYLGVVLLAAAEIALGLLVSALTDNQIVAFVGAAVASLLLLVAGEPALLGEAERLQVADSLVPLRTALVGALTRVGTGEHQDALARGVLDTRDLVYFFALTAFFLFANVIAVERRRGRVEAVLAVLLAAAAFFLAEDVATRRAVRFDLTSRRAFSLHPGTKAAFAAADARLTIRCYLSRDLPAGYERARRQLLDLLRELEAQGGRNVRLEVFDPKGDERLVEQARREGILSTTHQQVSQESAETKVIWCGLSLLYAGKPPVAIPLPFTRPNLEYDLSVAVRKLVQKAPRRVAWIELTDQQRSGFTLARQELARSYTVETVDLDARQEVPKDFQTAVLVLDAGAASRLTDRHVYALDQFVMRQGSLVVLAEPMSVDMQTLRAHPVEGSRIARAMERWGLSVPPRLLLARSGNMIPWQLVSQSARGYVVTNTYAYFPEPSSLTNRESPVASQVVRSVFFWAGEVVATAADRPGSVTTTLVKTAKDAWTVEGEVDLDPMKIAVPAQRDTRALAAAVSGEIPSAFGAPVAPTKPGPDPLGAHVARTGAGRLVVFGDTDFVRDTANALNSDIFVPNLSIFLNTIDWASEDASLATMRTRASLEPLTPTSNARPLAWAINLLGMPLLVGVAGVARFVLRRRSGRRAAQQSRTGAAA